MKTFEEADRLARKTLDAGPVGQERPCGCIIFVAGGYGWRRRACACGNFHNARLAQGWTNIENRVAKVRKLIQELTK